MNRTVIAVLCVVAGFTAGAIDFRGYADEELEFAEKYAFSTNRSELIATLPKDTGGWYFYTLLDLQTRGAYKEAREFVKTASRSKSETEAAWNELKTRQMFCNWELALTEPRQGGRSPDEFLAWELKFRGIEPTKYVREVAVPPNTYPSALDDEKVSFSAYCKAFLNHTRDAFEDRFAFLAFTDEVNRKDWFRRWSDYTPESPGFYEAVRTAILRGASKAKAIPDDPLFTNECGFKSLTLDQLARLYKEIPTLGAKDEFVNLVLAKLDASAGADVDTQVDLDARRRILDRKLAFLRQLPENRESQRHDVMGAILELEAQRGDYSEKELFIEYVRANKYSDKPFIREYYEAFRRAGSDLKEFEPELSPEARARLCARVDLLAGVEPSKVDVAALGRDEYDRLKRSVNLRWAKTNRRFFGAEEPVELALEVKNVKKLRLAIYVIDAFGATVKLGREVEGTVDLDGCVPTIERTLEYGGLSPFLLHTETLELPELGKCGIYVVECSGEGLSSRALVRKGSLRIAERLGAGGHVFTVLDEKGALVKPSRLRIGATTYSSDASGEIAVPFADEKSAGEKTVIIGAGNLAAVHRFVHRSENYQLKLAGELRAEQIVPGRKAKIVLMPRLTVAGETIPLELVRDRVLTLTLVDVYGVKTTRTIENPELKDAEEYELEFVAPSHLNRVDVGLSGRVRNLVTGRDDRVEDGCAFSFNDVLFSDGVVQAHLAHDSGGYTLSLKGRNGEPLAAREVKLGFKHLVFKDAQTIKVTLQTDAEGAVRLGTLTDIERVSIENPVATAWRLRAPVDMPAALTLVEGETVEFAVRGLFAGDWPTARTFPGRVSLVERGRNGEVLADALSCASYTNGVLKLTGLSAGDYTLFLKAENRKIDIRVAQTEAKEVVGDLIVGRHRGLVSSVSPSVLRIESAKIDSGTLRVRLAAADENTRVEVRLGRFMSEDSGHSCLPGLAPSVGAKEFDWRPAWTVYLSERDLGDELRYVLDRRNRSHRPGNMLPRPSMLLTPREKIETRTIESLSRCGSAYGDVTDGSARPSCAEPRMRGRTEGGSFGCGVAAGNSCYDFLAEPAAVWSNLKPEKDGTVALKLPPTDAYSRLEIVARTTTGSDRLELNAPSVPLKTRDLRHRHASAPKELRSKAYATIGELFDYELRECPRLEEFADLKRWSKLSDEARRAFYGEKASHELDLFLYFKDRAFFDAVVAPNLCNKRFKQFIDRWLLGEDLSEWTNVGRQQDLNALELCLLALRVPALRAQIAESFAAYSRANPVDPLSYGERLDDALGFSTGDSDEALMELESCELKTDGRASFSIAECAVVGAAATPRDDIIADVQSNWRGGRKLVSSPVKMTSLVGSRSPGVLGMMTSERKAADLARRQNRPLYHPPERTHEWVETHHYGLDHSVDTKELVTPNDFWRDYATAIAAGKEGEFRSTNIILVDGDQLTSVLGALAVTALPFESAENAAPLVFTEADRGGEELPTEKHFFDPENLVLNEANGDYEQVYGVDEFVAGKVYGLMTVVSNPSAQRRIGRSVIEIPDGAIDVGSSKAVETNIRAYAPFSMETFVTKFYFPVAEGEVKAMPSKEDHTTWAWISQNGTADEVFAFLEKANLQSPSVSLDRIGWRMSEAAFAERMFNFLSARGIYHEGLWRTVLNGRYTLTDFAPRARELFMQRDNLAILAPLLGPSFHVSIIDIDPEETDLYEHKEYWPLINARVHPLGEKTTIANESLRSQYREFLNVLATKRELSAKDRLDAAVYLIAQDRVDEAEAMVASVKADAVETKMQLDYLRAYFALSRLEPKTARKIAKTYENYPVRLWRERFGEVIAQVDEIEGASGARSRADAAAEVAKSASSLEIASTEGGVVSVVSRNVAELTVKAYPTDVEVTFSKNPFGENLVKTASAFLKPAWSVTVEVDASGETRVKLPSALKGLNLIVEAADGENRVSATRTLLSGALDVQVVAEYGELRVRDEEGRPLPAAYVKVYARNREGTEEKFYKDGYTDLRGAFNYAAVSTDSEFEPAEFAVLVLHDAAGVKTLRAQRP